MKRRWFALSAGIRAFTIIAGTILAILVGGWLIIANIKFALLLGFGLAALSVAAMVLREVWTSLFAWWTRLTVRIERDDLKRKLKSHEEHH